MEDAADDLAVLQHVLVFVAPTRGVAALEDQRRRHGGGGGFAGLAALIIRSTTARGMHQTRRRLRPREHKAIAAARPSSPTAPGIGDAAGFAAGQESWELLLCHCTSGKRSEYVMCVAVRHECLRRRQFAFIDPPAPVLFHKLPGLFHLRLPVPALCERRHRGVARRLIAVGRRAVLMLAVG